MALESGYAVIGIIDVLPEHRHRVVMALLAHRERCLRDEPGTLRLDCLSAQDDDNRLITYELYRDEVACAEHKRGASLRRMMDELRDRTRSVSSMRGTLLK